jgi:hypothetical protein
MTRSARNARPPTTPPAMAPTFGEPLESLFGGLGVGSSVGVESLRRGMAATSAVSALVWLSSENVGKGGPTQAAP